MKLSLPALLDAGRRFAAGLSLPRSRRSFTPQQARKVRRTLFLTGLTVAAALAIHPPSLRARNSPAARPGD